MTLTLSLNLSSKYPFLLILTISLAINISPRISKSWLNNSLIKKHGIKNAGDSSNFLSLSMIGLKSIRGMKISRLLRKINLEVPWDTLDSGLIPNDFTC